MLYFVVRSFVVVAQVQKGTHTHTHTNMKERRNLTQQTNEQNKNKIQQKNPSFRDGKSNNNLFSYKIIARKKRKKVNIIIIFTKIS